MKENVDSVFFKARTVPITDNITTRSVDSVMCIEVCGNYPAGPNNLG